MEFKLTLAEAVLIVRLARKAVVEFLKNGKVINTPRVVSERLKEKKGVFVTLKKVEHNKENRLRGCIGFPYPTYPLIEAVIRASIEASVKDPRFPPISLDELENIVFEVSVLTSPVLINVESPKEYPEKIKIGIDGLVVEKGFNKGLLLPQVPVEWKWEEEEYLSHCCMKAGLTPDCWLLKQTKIFKFSSIISQEISPKGRIEISDLREKNV
jgi:uncharacterized protein (TIGR00296 family)